ncbi:MAG: hypothetical protein J7604_18800 [Sporocytophaga sp.]|uniref:hypothetical protein n=1 Tax=Sporocytophaga sp. TaxID=2231183 RepID=UPI001B2BC613|nr:hypothetical protein [Sporocytophaga sp.]MBO9702266.1 hypothetical protein [Sporocytophaga sp.]
MKKTILLYFLFISVISIAQKIDLDKEYINIKYMDLPKSGVLNELKTYSVNLYSDPEYLGKLQLKDVDIENAVYLQGFEYVKDSRSADIILDVIIDKYETISESIENTTYESKDAQGKLIQMPGYYVLSNMIAPTFVKVTDNTNGREIENIGFATVNQPVILKSQTFPNKQEAINYIQKTLPAKRYDYFVTTYKGLFNNTFVNLRASHCFQPTSVNDIMWRVDLKKNPEFAQFNEELNKTVAALKAITHTQSLEATRTVLAPSLKYWQDNASKIDATDKKMRKIKYAYLINLALSQFYLEQLDDCEKTCNEIIANDYDAGDGKRILSNVTYLKKCFAANNTVTRHLERPGMNSTLKFRPAGNIMQITRPKPIIPREKPPMGYVALPGYLIDFDNNRIDGELWIYNLESEESFISEHHKALFVMDTPDGQRKMNITADNTSKLVLNKVTFESIKYRNPSLGSERYQLFRIMHENDKVKVYKHYATPILDNNNYMPFKMKEGASICLMKKSDQKIEVMGHLLPNKVADNTIKFYNDCPAVKSKIEAGEFKNMQSINSQISVAKFYAESCK